MGGKGEKLSKISWRNLWTSSKIVFDTLKTNLVHLQFDLNSQNFLLTMKMFFKTEKSSLFNDRKTWMTKNTVEYSKSRLTWSNWDQWHWISFTNKFFSLMGPLSSDHNRRLISFTPITLSGSYYLSQWERYKVQNYKF